MNMITEKKLKDTAETAKLQYYIKVNGYSQRYIADTLGITPQAVSRSLKGKSKISRVYDWLKNNINMDIEKEVL